MLLKPISEKDKFIMQMIANGDTALEVAEKTGASERTIESRIMILKKLLDCKNTTHLAITLLRNKIIN